MQMILLGYLLWSISSGAENKCYSAKTHMIYVIRNGVKVDSVNMDKKLSELKLSQNSPERSKQIEELFFIMEHKPCK